MDDVNAAFGKIDETLKANADAVAAKAEAETVTVWSRRRSPRSIASNTSSAVVTFVMLAG